MLKDLKGLRVTKDLKVLKDTNLKDLLVTKVLRVTKD